MDNGMMLANKILPHKSPTNYKHKEFKLNCIFSGMKMFLCAVLTVKKKYMYF